MAVKTTERAGPRVSTIPPHRAFADALVAGLIARARGDRLSLARGLILVPNRRASEAITAAFVRQAEAGLLLPRIVPIGDIDAAETIGTALDGIAGDPVPPAIDPLTRQLMLARLLQGAAKASGDPMTGGEAIRLAHSLGPVIDQLIVEHVAPSRLRTIEMTENLQHHWQVSLAKLAVIFDHWPAILAASGHIDATERRNRLLDRTADAWRANPPHGFVVAAGISTSAPAIAQLLHTVVRLPRGELVLAGLDQQMPDEEWAAIGGDGDGQAIETHPQFHLRRLLDAIGVARGDVDRWRLGSDADARAGRSRALSNAMAPAQFTGKWQTLPLAERSLAGVYALELDTPAHEAQAIAIALRHSIETQGQTAALVTPDRDLAQRVCAHLARWGIAAEDSAGQSLSVTVAGTMILALAHAAGSRFAPVETLTLLKHRLVSCGQDRLAWLDGVRSLDLALRGPRPPQGLAGISAYLASGAVRDRRVAAAAAAWWASVLPVLAPLEAGLTSLPQVIAAMRDAIAALCGDSAWEGPDGRAASALFEALERDGGRGPEGIDMRSIGDVLRPLMDAIAVRPVAGGHPRVMILGLIEAKLQSMPLMILAGLNEGVWPATPAPDPWLAPAIRRQLGLPGLERRIGLSAHDLVGAMGAPTVILTRAKRDASAPTIASRFWLRIEAITGGLRAPETDYAALANQIDRRVRRAPRTPQPAPCPAPADRPRRIAVTDVDVLLACPFSYYAKKVLRFPVLEGVDASPSAAWRGTLIHTVLQRWAKDHDYQPSALLPVLTAVFAEQALHPLTVALWLPRLEQAAAWIAQMMAINRDQGRVPVAAELAGEIIVDGVTLHGRADRIDRLEDGTLAIVDYKSGSKVPSQRQTSEGLANQLGLLGLIAERSGFENVGGRAVAFEYWSLASSADQIGFIKSATKLKATPNPAELLVAKSEAVVREAIARWLTGADPFSPKRAPAITRSDYDHLMRFDEWAGQ